jgi:hypothetical protein
MGKTTPVAATLFIFRILGAFFSLSAGIVLALYINRGVFNILNIKHASFLLMLVFLLLIVIIPNFVLGDLNLGKNISRILLQTFLILVYCLAPFLLISFNIYLLYRRR